MMTNLMALIDGSIYSQSVCDHAAWFANRSRGRVEIIHVLNRLEASGHQPENLSGSIGLGARTALLEELVELDAQRAQLLQKQGRAILDDARASVIESGVAVVTVKMRHGEIV